MSVSNAVIAPCVERERAAQPQLDAFYRRLGFDVDRGAACREYDALLTRDGRTVRVEEKIRSQLRGDLLVELVQDTHTCNMGWLFTTGCDWLVYAFAPENRLARVWVVKWPDFKEWMIDTYLAQKRPPHQSSDSGYGHTMNIVVALRAIPDGLIWRRDLARPATTAP